MRPTPARPRPPSAQGVRASAMQALNAIAVLARAETATDYISMGADPDLAVATKIAIQEMIDFLAATKKMDKHQAYQLTSLAGEVAITITSSGKPSAVVTKILMNSDAT